MLKRCDRTLTVGPRLHDRRSPSGGLPVVDGTTKTLLIYCISSKSVTGTETRP